MEEKMEESAKKMTNIELDAQDYKESDEGYLLFDVLLKKTILEHIDSEDKKKNIYSALCNLIWYNTELKVQCSYSWRHAGGIISEVNNEYFNENKWDYMDYYLSGYEGVVEDWIKERFNSEGWLPAYYEFKKRIIS